MHNDDEVNEIVDEVNELATKEKNEVEAVEKAPEESVADEPAVSASARDNGKQPAKKEPFILFACHSTTSTVSFEHLQMVLGMLSSGLKFELSFLSHTNMVLFYRDALASFLAGEYTHLILADGRAAIDRDSLVAIINSGLDIVSPVWFLNEYNFGSVQVATIQHEQRQYFKAQTAAALGEIFKPEPISPDVIRARALTYQLIPETGPGDSVVTRDGRFIQAASIDISHLVVIRREAIELMTERLPECRVKISDEIAKALQLTETMTKNYWTFFDMIRDVDGDGGDIMLHMTSFCHWYRKAVGEKPKAGYDMWYDTAAITIYRGDTLMVGNFHVARTSAIVPQMPSMQQQQQPPRHPQAGAATAAKRVK